MTDLLQRLQRALPWVGQWIDDLHAKYSQSSVSASATRLPRVATSFPVSLLQRARAATVDSIPFPPVSAYGLPELESIASMPMAGITFGHMYFVHSSYSHSEGIHFHELVHVVQWTTLGVNEFLLTYALGIAQHGYEQSPLEAIAFDLQNRFERHAALPGIVDVVARHAVSARDTAAAVFRSHGLEMGA